MKQSECICSRTKVCQQLQCATCQGYRPIQFPSSGRSSQSNGAIDIGKGGNATFSFCGEENNGPQRDPHPSHLSAVPGHECHPLSPGSSAASSWEPPPHFPLLCVPHRNKALTTVLGNCPFTYLPFHLYSDDIFLFSPFLVFWHLGLADQGETASPRASSFLKRKSLQASHSQHTKRSESSPPSPHRP